MSEHDEAELVRQLDAARSRATEARRAVQKAEDRLSAYRVAAFTEALAARGIVPGAKVHVTWSGWNVCSVNDLAFSHVEASRHGNIYARFVALKQDGSVGRRVTSSTIEPRDIDRITLAEEPSQ